MFTTVLFDFDGTLVASEPAHASCWAELVRPHGYELSMEEYRDRFSGVTTPHAAAEIAGKIGGRVPPGELQRLKEERYREWLATNGIPLAPGAKAAIDAVRDRGLVLGLVTGSPREQVLPVLEQHGLGPVFRCVITRDDVRESKPHPDCYLAALSALRVTSDRAVAVEDSASGLAAAKAAGLACVAVRTEWSVTHDLGRADHVCGTLDQAAGWVLEQAGEGLT
jgi:HAD superfamily hydrolase (TIGR01509 family)